MLKSKKIRFQIVVFNYNRIVSFLDNFFKIQNFDPDLDEIVVVDCSSNFKTEKQQILNFCKKNNYAFKKTCKIYRRSNWGMNQGGWIDYCNYLRSVKNKPEYIWQFQEHFLDLLSPWSWRGENVYNIDGSNFSGQIRADTIPDNCNIDLDYCEKIYRDSPEVNVIFAARKNVGIFKYSDDKWFYIDGMNFSVRTSSILKHFTKTLLNCYKLLYDENYNYSLFLEFNICYHLSKNKQAWHDLVRRKTFISPADLKLQESITSFNYHQDAKKEYIPIYDYYFNKLCLLNGRNNFSTKYDLFKRHTKSFANKFTNLWRASIISGHNYTSYVGQKQPAEEYGLFGTYSSWEEATKHCTGYDSKIILDKVKRAALKVKNNEAVYERESVIFNEIHYSWPILSGLLWIASLNNNRLNLIDFGGSLGTSYYQNRNFLRHLETLTWNIVEQEHFVKCGKKFFEDEHLKFHFRIEDCIKGINKPDTILLSGVLNYIEKPYELLQKIADLNFQYLLIDRTPFSMDSKEYLKVQKVSSQIYEGSYPLWIFELEKFREAVCWKYELIAEFDSLIDTGNCKGFICKRLSDSELEQKRLQRSSLNADLITQQSVKGARIEDGLGPLEGPYPQWDLPRVRWAKKNRVCIEFYNFDEKEFKSILISMSFRPQVRPAAQMTVKFNGLEIKEYDITGQEVWHDDVLTLVPQRGSNLIEFVFPDSVGVPPPPDSNYMLFRKLSLSYVG